MIWLVIIFALMALSILSAFLVPNDRDLIPGRKPTWLDRII